MKIYDSRLPLRCLTFVRPSSLAARLPILLTLLATTALAAEVSLSVNPPLISLGEAAQVSVEVRGSRKAAAPRFPQVNGLTFSGTSQSSQMSFVNGKTDKSVRFTATVYPQKTGEFAIGPFDYQVDGETKTLQGTLKVVASSGDAMAAQSWSELIFAKMTSNRDKAYVQEPFELTLSVYSNPGLQIQGVNNLRGMPETGLAEPEWKAVGQTREEVNGQIYDIRQFKAEVRTMGSGKYEFAPTVTVQVAAPQQQQQRQRDPFGFDSFFNRVQTRPVELQVEPASVSVLPLPTIGKPDSFSGAVGRFQFQVTAAPKEVHPGDPITMQMTIVGEGNYDRIQPPALPADAPFRLFGDAVRQQGNNGVRFEQAISPRDADVAEIPPVEFSFFDTQSGTYRTVSSPAIPITVTASSNDTAQLFVAKDTIVAPPVDQPFATESDVQRFEGWLKRGWQVVRPWLWTIPAALGAGLLIFFGRRLYHWRRKDVAWVRRQQAPKAARQALQQATQARKQGDAAAFYNAMGSALADYFANRLNLPPGEASAETVLQSLRNKDVPEDILQTVQTLFEQVEAARYSPAGQSLDEQTASRQQADFTQLLKQLEKQL